ncbi:MAG: hypothetical protein AABX93_02905 [Nanoarchaeota archaeon]
MGLFGFGKKEKVIDLTEKYRKQYDEKILNASKTQPSMLQNIPEIVAEPILQNNKNEFTINPDESVDERRKKLTNRIMEMSMKIEELSNQVFLLQQRIEVLEMKNRAIETPTQETQNNYG